MVSETRKQSMAWKRIAQNISTFDGRENGGWSTVGALGIVDEMAPLVSDKVRERVSQLVGQSVSQSVIQSVIQSVSRSVGRSVGQSVS